MSKRRTTIGDLIAEARGDKQLSQHALAKKLGVSQSTVSAWEKGIHPVTPTVLRRLARVLDLDLTGVACDRCGRPLTAG